MLIMEYANNGNLRECLTEITSNWYQKLFILYKIIDGLNEIHKENFIHYDFHDGNIMCNKYTDFKHVVFISNYLESFQLAKFFLKKDNIYGIIPFIAPEILKGKPYTQASNIYSFSIIMWEFTSGVPPFNNRAHDIQLALSICKGERPEIIENTPQCYIDLMKKCWDEDPLKRPSASEILGIIKKWISKPSDINEELKNNIMEFINAPIKNNNPITEFHPQAYYKSCLLNFTSKKLNEILGEPFKLKENAEQKLLKLEMIANTYYESSQMELRINQKELKEMHLAYQKIKLELANLQQQNFQWEQNYQNSTEQIIKEFAEKENTLQAQITYLQSEKQALTDDLVKQLEQNKLTNQQTSQLEQEKNNLQDQLFQAKTNIQELKSQQESLFEQKEQLGNKLSQFQQQIEEGKFFKDNIFKALLQAQEFTNKGKDEKAELKAKLETEITQLEQKLINEKQIKGQLSYVLQIKDKIDEKKLVISGQECIKQPGKEISASYNDNRKKQILNQVNEFLKAKGDFLTLQEKTIKKLQKQYEVISDRIAIGIIEEVVSETKKFQDILVECNEIGLFQMNEDHNSLMNIIQENKELEVSLKINDILKVDSFDLNKYKIITIATNSWEGIRTHLDSDMMAEDIKSLKKNLGELKSELRQQKKELKNLVD
jgi:serine/threonine protein kinase